MLLTKPVEFSIYFLVLCSTIRATTYHSDGSSQNIQALHDIALDGDTITVPRGTFTWKTAVVIRKAITIRGAGSGLPSLHGNSTSVIHGAGTNILLSFIATQAGVAKLIGLRFTSTQADGYIIRTGPVQFQDCWFRTL